MPAVNITDTSQYVNLSSLSGVSGSVVVTNNSSHPVYALTSATQPASSALGILCWNSEEIFVNNRTAGESVWVRATNTGPLYVQAGLSASAQYIVANLPPSLLTSGPEGVQRIRVDDTQTSFFQGTQARTFMEAAVAAGASLWVRATVPLNIVLYELNFTVDAGSMRISTYSGGTASGTWTTQPVIRKNTMSDAPAYTPQVAVASGGAMTGGTLNDVVRVVSSSATAQQSTVGTVPFSERGIGAGTYFYKIENIGTGTINVVLHAWWEERP